MTACRQRLGRVGGQIFDVCVPAWSRAFVRGAWVCGFAGLHRSLASSSCSLSSSPSSPSSLASREGRRRGDQGDGSGEPHRAARFVAALFMASAAYQVFPLVPSALVEHTIKLMRTDQAFLQDVGMSRLQWLSRFEPVRQRARELGAVEAIEAMDGRVAEGRVAEGWEARRHALLAALREGGGDVGSTNGGANGGTNGGTNGSANGRTNGSTNGARR